MKAFIVDRYGSADRVRASEVPDPEMREDDVLIEIHAAGVNPLDSKIRDGEFKLLLPYRLPLILGRCGNSTIIDFRRIESLNEGLGLTAAANTIVELIARQSHRTPDALAILAPGRAALTFEGLTRQIGATILSLATSGFGRGDRVALALPNSPEMAVALLAVTGGATCVPLNPALEE